MAKLTLKTSLSLETQARLFSTMGKEALATMNIVKIDVIEQPPVKIKPLPQANWSSKVSDESGINKPTQRKWKEYVKKVKGVQEWLHEKWPLVFDLAHPKPLKRRIENDIMIIAGNQYTVTQIRKSLGAYTSRTDYMKAMIDQNWRYNLDNQPVEEITQSQKDFTLLKMLEKDKQVKKRMKEFDIKLKKLKIARSAIAKSKKKYNIQELIKTTYQTKQNIYKRHALVELAQTEAKQKNRGDDNNSGVAIEKYLSPLRTILAKDDPEFLNLQKGFDWCALFVHYLVNQCGFDVPLVPWPDNIKTMGLVGIWYEWACLNQKFYKPDIPLIPGDIILFDNLMSSSPLDHMGIVITALTTYIITAEGNVDRSTGMFRREYDATFRGFIRL